MMRQLIALATLGTVATLAAACGRQMGTSETCIPLDSPGGADMLAEADSLRSFTRIVGSYETQTTQTFCGVASCVIALNSTNVPAPTPPQWAPYRAFTQDRFFSAEITAQESEEKVRRSGMTLAELADALTSRGARIMTVHAETASLDAFRHGVRSALAAGDVVIVNYHRPELGQSGGGHFSPLGAYHAASDRFLIMDVARYRLPPVWASAPALWQGMVAVDQESKRSRGFVIVHDAHGAMPAASADR